LREIATDSAASHHETVKTIRGLGRSGAQGVPKWSMNRSQILLIALAALVLAGVALFRHSALAALATVLLCAGTAAYIFMVYRRVRAKRKAREKAEILRRVAVLEDRRRNMSPVASSVDLSLREFGGSPQVMERGMPPGTS
jgi:Flp pilus assembly protein TadB